AVPPDCNGCEHDLMGQLKSSAPFFRPGPPAPMDSPDQEILDFLCHGATGRILDVGGGMAAYANALRARGYDVTLAEIDPLCLENARKHGIDAVDMNVTPWESLYARYETIVLVDVLEHVP